MDILWIILGIVFIVSGLVGSFLPVIPGPPLSFLGLIMLELTTAHPFSFTFLAIWGFVVVVLMFLDNVIPAWGTKKFGGSPWGVWGSMIGMVVGIFFSPVGIVVGPFVGSLAGELLAGKKSNQAFRAAMGSFVGFLAGTLLNLIASGLMGYYFFMNM